MSTWTQDTFDEIINFIKKSQDDFNNQVTVMEAQAPRAAMELQGAQAQIDGAKQTIQQTIDSIQRKTNEVKSIVSRMSDKQKEATDNVEKLKQDVAQLEKDVEANRVLSQIRKEQAESLAQKRIGNLHSSWMGLYRPMKDTSRFGIFVLSITLVILCALMAFFAYSQGYFVGVSSFLWEKLKSSGGLVAK